MKLVAAALTLLTLTACGPTEPEPAANRFGRVENEIDARANQLNAQVENELAQTEQRLEEEASQALNSLNAAAANSANEAAPAPEASAPAQNKARR